MQEQQAVNRVTREQHLSLFQGTLCQGKELSEVSHFTAVLLSAFLPIPTVTP